jgi:predicted lipoprotein with Yx(FWY)xxD motif
MNRLIAIGGTAGLLALAGCGGGDDSNGEDGMMSEAAATTTKSSPEPAAGKGTTIQVSSSDYGRVLFDSDDQAIYLFDKEQGSKSECYGECAAAWPPVLTEGEPQAGPGTDASLLGTTQRNDGTTQITYGGHPLYYYAHEGPGQVLCQNVEEFGGLWLVVDPSGEAVR